MREDYEHLKVLGICTIVHGAVIGLTALATFAYMCAVATTADSALAGGVLVLIGMLICGLFVVQSLITIASGIGLMQHKWRWVSYLSAGLSCLNAPMGTVLAIFTFIVLSRPSVRAIYEGHTFAFVPAARPVPPTPRYAHTTRPDSPLRVRVAG